MSDARKYREVGDLETQKRKFEEETRLAREDIQQRKEDIKQITNQKSMGFPWLAEAYADYFALKDGELAKFLLFKKRPAYTAAVLVKELVKENKIVTYKLNYLTTLFPWLSELIAEDESEEIPVRIINDNTDGSNEDRAKDYLTPEEYKQLPSVERNQLALDRYLKSRNKSKWAIGRDYEMYIGHWYTKEGYCVEYKGIVDGFDDLGRDVIAKRDKEICIIQCKYWAEYKDIHEKHIFQLFGTTMEYWINNVRQSNVQMDFDAVSKALHEKSLRALFVTSTTLSNRAKRIANALSIEVVENKPIDEFPRIKCNINIDLSGRRTKIYHLPMDQQYDRTIVGDRDGEFYAYTVREAEDAGFRRAWRWKGNKVNV
jgi:hypothetical protein